VRPKASGAGLVCRTDQYFQCQRLTYTCSLHRFNSITVTMLKWWVWYRSMFGVPVKFVCYIVQVPNDWPKWRHWLL